jgi:K+-sensing histidine kinase KdpD
VTQNILVVDDMPANLTLLAEILKQRGYRVRPVPSGELALEAARAEPPDLVLLDIDMPELNGFEVIAQLKADARLRDTPVIFLTAHTDVTNKVKAFSLGGVDYVTKPFQAEEIYARVATHLALRRQQRELQARYDQLAALEKMRDELVHMIVHDLRSPLAGVCVLLDLMIEDLAAVAPQAQSDVAACRATAQRMIEMITTILDVNQIEAAAMKLALAPCDLVATTRGVITEMRALATDRHVVLEPATPSVRVIADARLVGRVVQNLLANALRFTPRGGTVRIAVDARASGVRFAMCDEGKGVPEVARTRIFEKFGALDPEARGHSTGLGLPFCRMAIEAHGGAIGVDANDGRPGSTFWFTLPADREQ